MSCSVVICDRPAEKRGWCGGHYRRWHRSGDVRADAPLRLPPASIEEALSSKTDKTGECWLWTGAIQSGGYGEIRHLGRTRLAHRVSYEVHVGPIPIGLQLDHLCRNTRCVNPTHLEPVTQSVNVRRAFAARRSA